MLQRMLFSNTHHLYSGGCIFFFALETLKKVQCRCLARTKKQPYNNPTFAHIFMLASIHSFTRIYYAPVITIVYQGDGLILTLRNAMKMSVLCFLEFHKHPCPTVGGETYTCQLMISWPLVV